MTPRLFTRADVDALIPRLTALVGMAVDRHHEAVALRGRLEAEQERMERSGDALVARREWTARVERLDGLTIEIRAAMEDVAALGGTMKDLELGLVDFPGLGPLAGAADPVNLCWKLGETAVGFWHGGDEGYAQRKPLP